MSDRPVGWHADLEAGKYRYWDGERWAFTSSAKDLEAYRAAGQVVAGVDFTAPVHSELPPEKKERRVSAPAIVGGLVAVAVLIVLLAVLL
jgi:hypothetical protein